MKIVVITNEQSKKFNKLKEILVDNIEVIKRKTKFVGLENDGYYNAYRDALKFNDYEKATKHISRCCELSKELANLEREKVLTEAIIELIEALA